MRGHWLPAKWWELLPGFSHFRNLQSSGSNKLVELVFRCKSVVLKHFNQSRSWVFAFQLSFERKFGPNEWGVAPSPLHRSCWNLCLYLSRSINIIILPISTYHNALDSFSATVNSTLNYSKSFCSSLDQIWVWEWNFEVKLHSCYAVVSVIFITMPCKMKLILMLAEINFKAQSNVDCKFLAFLRFLRFFYFSALRTYAEFYWRSDCFLVDSFWMGRPTLF